MKYNMMRFIMVSGFKYQSIHDEKELNIPDKSSGNSNWNAYHKYIISYQVPTNYTKLSWLRIKAKIYLKQTKNKQDTGPAMGAVKVRLIWNCPDRLHISPVTALGL